jgi:3-isopropylmalate/(R)-2-methylmalate dehydratase large subunit
MALRATHPVHRILARASGKPQVEAGEIVTCAVDVAQVNDLYLQVIRSFEEMGGQRVAIPDQTAFVMDHYAPAPTIKSAANQKAMREFVERHGIAHLVEVGDGVCHQVLIDMGLVRPGSLVVATDSHTTTHGALGAFGTGVGATDMAAILLTGRVWLRVPEVARVRLEGTLPGGVMAKDVILRLLRQLGADAAVYQALEFSGAAVSSMSVSERLVLSNMAVEMGAKTSYIAPDQLTLEYLARRGVPSGSIDLTLHEPADPGFRHAWEHILDVTGLEPQVAVPPGVDTAVDVGEVAGTRIDQALIGTCTGGRLSDIEVAARILAGRRVARGTRLIVIPASRAVLQEAVRRVYVQVLLEAGVCLATPGCGPCLGAHQGVLAPGEVCISASSRNFPGRMGSTEARIFLASPATVAASAVEGRIADPRPYLR